MRWPQGPVINHAGSVFSAYGFTLEDIIVRAWEGNRWHVDITSGLRADARFDFLMVLPQEEPTATCLGLLKSAIEQHFAVQMNPRLECCRHRRDILSRAERISAAASSLVSDDDVILKNRNLAAMTACFSSWLYRIRSSRVMTTHRFAPASLSQSISYVP
jgi:hypothetical protein